MTAHRVLYDMLRAPFLGTDPGDAGTISVDRYGYVCPVETSSDETRTLAQPSKAGLMCLVTLSVDSGDLTLTVTGGFNENDDTSITFNDAGDSVLFYSIKEGSSYYWRVAGEEGTNAAVYDMTPGSGISSGTNTICEHAVYEGAGLTKTEILVDLTGLNDGGAADDIIGVDGGTANCHIGQITAAVNGTIVAGRVTCFEAPNGGNPDVDLYSAVESDGAQDAAISGLDETKLIDHGNWSAADIDELSALPAADAYLYLVNGASTDGTYTAGILLIELWGT